MKKQIVFFMFCLFCISISGQNGKQLIFNFGFEMISNKGKLPDNWFQMGKSRIQLKIDSVEKYSGSYSLLIDAPENKSSNEFGCCAYFIPANYEGSQIEVKAYMKLQNVANGPIGLMLRIDGENGPLAFDNMQQNNIQGTTDWKLYSVKLPLNENAKTIYIGAILSGTGKLWVDDFQILIDGVDLSKAKLKKTILLKADTDTAFEKGSKINTVLLKPSKLDDLVILCKVWGFLKYYHPSIAKGEYNWDYELFKIAPAIIQSKNIIERNKIFFNWVSSIGYFEKDSLNASTNSHIKLSPDLDWIKDESILGNDLTRLLLEIKNAKRGIKNYYVSFDNGVKNPQFKNERNYANIDLKTDAGYRMLCLFRYWNIIQYYFPYKYLIGKNWNDVLPEFLPKYLAVTTDLEYKLTTLELIARVHDTHANIWGIDKTIESFKGIYEAPLGLRFIENRAIVTTYLDSLLSKNSGLEIGDIIVSVNGIAVNDIINNRLPISPASNYSTQLRDIARDILRSNDTIINITYQRGMTTNALRLKCFLPQKLSMYDNKYYKKDTCFKFITPDIAYIYPGSIKSDYLPKIASEFSKTKGLIIDMRCYPSQFIVFSLGEYFMPDSTGFVKFSRTSTQSPGLFTLTDVLKVGKKNDNFYKGKIVIIINEITQSQAEYTTMAFRVAPNALVIGSTTAGADGNMSSFNLPGGIRTAMSGIGIYYPDGNETQRVGIIPDIVVKPTIKGIASGHDELLEKAVELINK